MEYTLPKGVFDTLPLEPKEEDQWRNSSNWQHVESVMRSCASTYGFKEIRTPIFEKTELFIRGVGENSDIVMKEMFTFPDKAGRSMTLRPEGTAPAMRAFLEKKLYQQTGTHKYFYIAPMFRYERPQAGRYRQHHQFGVEAIGSKAPEQDVEVIDLLYETYRHLGLKNLKVHLNSVGDKSSSEPFRRALQAYLEPHFASLSGDSQIRFSKNILRILDSKDPTDCEILQSAPSILDHLSPEARSHFESVQNLLAKIGIPFEVNPRLVRGLDYYQRTVFEVTSEDLGAQNSVGGGGRYDGLTTTLGGPDLPAVGFGTGIERLLQTMVAQNAPFPEPPHPKVFFIPLGERARQFCFETLTALRRAGISCEIDLSGKKVGHGLQLADAEKAKFALVIGDDELQSGEATLKEMSSREGRKVSLPQITLDLIQLFS